MISSLTTWRRATRIYKCGRAPVLSLRFSLHLFFPGPPRPADHQIAERDDPDQPLVAIEHRQPAHLPRRHLAGALVGVLVLEAEAHLARHRLAHRCFLWVTSLRDAAHGDVAVGDHADEAIILADRQYAGVDIGHH